MLTHFAIIHSTHRCSIFIHMNVYSELPNKRADCHFFENYKRLDWNKRVAGMVEKKSQKPKQACLLGSSE